MKKYKLTAIAIFVSILTACQLTQVEQQSSVAVPTQFDQAQVVKGSAEIQQWWRNWHDPQLIHLIEQGLEANLDIKLAQARLNEVQANSDYAEADRGINVGASGSAGAGVSNVNTKIINPSRSDSRNAYGGIQASWEPDFFGKKRSDVDVAQAIVFSQQAQVYAAQLLVSSQIADNYFRIHALEKRHAIIGQNLATLTELKRYIQGRFNAGQASAYEVNEISTQISALQASQATLKAQADIYERNIAVLLGQSPQGFHIVKNGNPLANIPQAPAGQYPNSVIERRPDLQASQYQIQAMAAKVASAKADLYPRFDINFLGQGGYIKLDNELSHLSGLAGLASAGVQLPIFTNGRIQANIDGADARLKAAVIQYDKTLLTALAEVDSAYQTQYSLVNQTNLLKTAYTQANKQASDAQTLFKHDEKTLDVALRAKISALNYQEQIVQSQLAQAQNLISLYKALGGGWQAQ
ncbi:efflux transporter outer membrane subunit [Actinobacillus vicugnae]|uniref:efflux transporter outer membrane subunit n=1 Tax=Actinobacillus vicugnae TaxID=2573093 RepID=UPI00124007C3|nr:efflux transporter outer membrane subunit [Actinobacillus vicugnae]